MQRGTGGNMDDVEVSTPSSCSCCGSCFPTGYFRELKQLLLVSAPIVAIQLLQFLMGPVAVVFCGHLGKTELDAVALANSMINVTGISIATGLSTGCDTLFAQVYGSANRKKLGVYVQRSLWIILLGIFPCYAIHLNTESFLIVIGQDVNVARLAGRYLLIFMPGLLSFFIYIVLSKYMQNQNVLLPNVVIALVGNAVNALLHYLLIYQWHYDTDGSAIAQACGYFTLLACTVGYILCSKLYRDTWQGWTRESLSDWGDFFKLAFAGLLMLCIEWWSFEVGVFLTGVLGTTELGAQSVIFQLETITYMLPLGMSIASSIRVGQYLGAGNPEGAKTVSNVSITVIAAIGLFIGALLTLLRHQLPLIFTNVSDVVSLAGDVLPILGSYMVFDAVAGVCGGILRGSGRQNIGAVIVMVGYGVGLPIAIYLMFKTSLRVKGLWIALAGALCCESIIYLLIMITTNWQQEADKALVRTRSGEFDTNNEQADEVTALLGNRRQSLGTSSRRISFGFTRRRSSVFVLYDQLLMPPPPEEDATDPIPCEEERVPWRLLLPKRLLVLCIMLALLAGSILIRIYVSVPVHWTELCNPSNTTQHPALPPCNITSH